jgi:hypothetical protein
MSATLDQPTTVEQPKTPGTPVVACTADKCACKPGSGMCQHPPTVVTKKRKLTGEDAFASQHDEINFRTDTIAEGGLSELLQAADAAAVAPRVMRNLFATTQREMRVIKITQDDDDNLVIANTKWIKFYERLSHTRFATTKAERCTIDATADTGFIWAPNPDRNPDDDLITFKSCFPVKLTASALAQWTLENKGIHAASLNALIYIEEFLRPLIQKVLPEYTIITEGDILPAKLKIRVVLQSNDLLYVEGDTFIANQTQMFDLYKLGFRRSAFGAGLRYQIEGVTRQQLLDVHIGANNLIKTWGKFFNFEFKKTQYPPELN